MDTEDKTPPAATVEDELSVEEKAIRQEALERQQQSRTTPTSDDDLPKVHSEADQ